ncbi:hypothetical protein GCM10009129_11610 [Psychrobacter aestuarii]|uniref:TolC family protein n=1 Tax=Psychrobacter aestuarii TaxID=556327 RepID=A0ABP3FEA4_9GAMM
MPLILSITCSITAHAEYEDLQVNQLINDAIQSHPRIQAAMASQQATTEGITAAKLNLLPEPSISSGYDRDNDFVSQVNIRQPLWTGGRLSANVNQAIYDDKAAVETIYEQQNTVAKTTIDAWQSYIQAIAQQRIHLDNLNVLADFEAMMQRRVGQGVSARIELDLVTNRILQEQTAYQGALEQQRIAAARLSQLTGRAMPTTGSSAMPSIKALSAYAKQQAVSLEQQVFGQNGLNNPSVVKAQFEIESAKQQVLAQRAARYPTLYAQYEHAYYHDDEDTDRDNDGKFSVGLSYSPGAGLSNFALSRASEAQVSSLIQSQEAARRDVIEDIQVRYQKFSSAKDREVSLVAAVAGAQMVVSSYRRQFIAGRKSWLEVLNAVREHNDYQVQLVQTRAELLGSFYRLQVDLGLMPWQSQARNRTATETFSPVDSVRTWLQNQTDTLKRVASSARPRQDSSVRDRVSSPSETVAEAAALNLGDGDTMRTYAYPQLSTHVADDDGADGELALGSASYDADGLMSDDVEIMDESAQNNEIK